MGEGPIQGRGNGVNGGCFGCGRGVHGTYHLSTVFSC